MSATIDPSAGHHHRPLYASRDRSGDHPERHLRQFTGILQANAYAGCNGLYLPERNSAPVTEALCWSHARLKFFVLADIATIHTFACA